jgi:hypothetical protein
MRLSLTAKDMTNFRAYSCVCWAQVNASRTPIPENVERFSPRNAMF